MKSIIMAAAAAVAVSQMAEASRFYPDVRDAERRRNTPTTFKYPYRMVIDVEDIDLLGKSHGKSASKRKTRRERSQS